MCSPAVWSPRSAANRMAAASASGSSAAASTSAMASMTSERALVHLYNPVTRAWSQQPATTIAVESQPFGEGNFRQAYRARMAVDGKPQEFVIKVARDPNTPRSLYFNDAEAQGVAILWAKKYNESKPPKAVEFVPCFVVELVDRPGRPLANCEQHIRGEFKKYNNNVGAAVGGGMGGGGGGGNGSGHASAASAAAESSLEARTAQCFSHFTYQHSGCQILICDIQGVGGLYTDPQIHTVTGKGFGEGNLGGAGITAFLLRHTCNDLCAQLGLSKVQPKNLDSSNAKVVLPVNAAPLLASKASGVSSGGGSKSGAGSGGGGADILVIDSSSSGSTTSAGVSGGATPKKPHAGSHGAADAAGDRKATSGPAGARASAIASKASTTVAAAAAGATGSSKSSSKSQSQQRAAAPAATQTDAPMEVRGHGHVKQPSLSPKKINADDEALMNSILTS